MNTITIVSVVDVVGALTDESLNHNLYLLDNNKIGGSQNLGTGTLKTKVSKGDKLLWTIMPMEPESYSAIENIKMDKSICEPKQFTYTGSDVVYWEGTVKKDFDEIPYSISFAFGNLEEVITTSEYKSPSLIGKKAK